jgi:ATP synthase E chain.
VLRYSALVAGLIYGVSHQSSLNSQAKHAEIERDYKRKESLIQQAKAEWAKTHAPAKKSEGRMLYDLSLKRLFSTLAPVSRGITSVIAC